MIFVCNTILVIPKVTACLENLETWMCQMTHWSELFLCFLKCSSSGNVWRTSIMWRSMGSVGQLFEKPN